MKPTFRAAGRADRHIFLDMWQGYLDDQYEGGSGVPPTEHNLREYLKLYDSYVTGALHGLCMLAEDEEGEPAGLIFAGEELPGALNLDTPMGRCITLWGVYVRPAFRGQHLAWQMQDAAHVIWRDTMNFKTCVSTVLLGYPQAEKNAFEWPGGEGGVAQKHSVMIVVPLRREEALDGRFEANQ